jgi:hypothetical protein
MFGSKPPEAIATVLAQLTKRHRKLLKTGEVFLAACDAFSASEPHPEPLSSRRRHRPVAVTSSEERLGREAAARFRLTSVQAALSVHDDDFTELPPSDNGFLLSHTDRRMLIFDGAGKKYQLQSPMKGLWLQPIDHGDDMYTLVFNNGKDRVAFATRRESVEMTKTFIDSFPDRRQQTRVLSVTNDSDIIEF